MAVFNTGNGSFVDNNKTLFNVFMFERTPRTQKKTAVLTTANTTQQTLLASQGAGNYADLYGIIFDNDSASNTEVLISDGTNTYQFFMPGSTMDGVMLPMDSAIPATTANLIWTAQTTVTVANCKISAFFVINTQ